MKIKKINENLSVCKLKNIADADLCGELYFLGKTDEEISLVCPTETVPDTAIAGEDGWKAFRIEGTLDFSLIGILARISALLAAENIGIFVVSTYNTDYVLTKAEDFDKALNVLEKNGYTII